VTRNRLIGLVLLVAAVIGIHVWWSSDRRRINARLAELEEMLGKSGAEDQLAAFGRTRHIVEQFAPGFVVSAKPYEGTITDLQQLAAVIMKYRESSGRIAVADSERDLAIDDARGTAETTALFVISGDRGGGPGRERFRARVDWVRIGGEWKIQEFEILEVLERGLLGL
jgi:hypothetical protein